MKNTFDDLLGRIVTFHQDQGSEGLLVGKVISWDSVPHTQGDDCLMTIEGRTGKTLSIPSFIDHDCRLWDTWDQGRHYANLSPEGRSAYRTGTKVRVSTPDEAITVPPELSPAAGDAALEKRLDRIEKLMTLVAVATLDKPIGDVHALIESMSILAVKKGTIV
tara:strand:+ start:3930 stop:4418 length:489 start_codon:yes stop_codon:yes gene_type:complete